MKKYIYNILFLFIILLPIISLAQEDKDKNKNDYQKSFDEFSNSINQDFKSFKTKNDSIFYQFLKQSWSTFNLFKDTRPSLPKPIVQPISDTASIRNIEISPLKRRTMLQDTGRQLILNGKPTNFQTKAVVSNPDIPTTVIDFYGLTIEIPAQTEKEPEYSTITNKDIALYFKTASNNDYLLATIELLHNKALDTKLNGWGYIGLLKAAASSLYNDINNQVLFTWYALLKSGYDARVGYNNQNIILLAAFDVPIYYSSYFEWDGKKYYHVPYAGQVSDMKAVSSYEGDYNSNQNILSLYFSKPPVFAQKIATRKVQFNNQAINLSYDMNLIDYYSTYPECELSVYFPPPLSDFAISSLGEFLAPLLNNKTDMEKVNIMLDFIQHTIDYETDEKQFGSENYLFAEETLFYPYADCEDRSILLSQLIKEFIGLSTIAIVYPNHISLGVNVEENIKGAYVEYKNSKYYIADPTYIGAKLGMIMPEFENTEPEIIIF